MNDYERIREDIRNIRTVAHTHPSSEHVLRDALNDLANIATHLELKKATEGKK